MNECNDPDHGAINAERSESRGLRKAWIELDDKRQELERELTAVTEQRDVMEKKLRIELRGHPDSELWGEAGLIAATMRCVDALDVVTAQRDRLAEEVGQLKSRLTQTHGSVTISRNGYVQELEQQRDRLVEALLELRNSESFSLCGAAYAIIEQALQSLTPNAIGEARAGNAAPLSPTTL
jgi:chromosome segregation ATPase